MDRAIRMVIYTVYRERDLEIEIKIDRQIL